MMEPEINSFLYISEASTFYCHSVRPIPVVIIFYFLGTVL